MIFGLIDVSIIVSLLLILVFIVAVVVGLARLKRPTLNVVVAFLLCEWLVPGLIANFAVPELVTRLAVFAGFVVGLLAASLRNRGALPRQPEARCPWCKSSVPSDAVVCRHCTRDMRDLPVSDAASVRLETDRTMQAQSKERQECCYCRGPDCDVTGLYGATYHRSCHAQTLRS